MVNGISNSTSNINFPIENHSQKVSTNSLPLTESNQNSASTASNYSNLNNSTLTKRELPPQNLLQTSLLKQNIANSLATSSRDSLTATTLTPLKVGSKGSSVIDLQTKLKNIGFDIGKADGIFGPATDRALRSFQREHGLKVTGTFDQTTSSALDKAAAFINKTGRVNASFDTDRSTRETQASEILRANKVIPKEGQFYAIQIDQDSPSANAPTEQIDQWMMGYTGQTSVFKCQNGKLVEVSAQPYLSASHPSMKTADTLGGTVGYQDVNKDGVADIGHMRTGVYQYTKTGERYSPVGGANLAVARDLDHNGVIDANEAKLQYTATGLQIHAGEDEHPHSAACQTLPPADYANLQKDLSQNRNSSFTYVLVRRPNDLTGANPF